MLVACLDATMLSIAKGNITTFNVPGCPKTWYVDSETDIIRIESVDFIKLKVDPSITALLTFELDDVPQASNIKFETVKGWRHFRRETKTKRL